MSTVRAAFPPHRAHLANALASLKQARTAAIAANCPRLLRKIRSAIKSAGGAERHLHRREAHTNGGL